ncbi:MAG: DUF2199 domain-containing protein [Janthinobacterium lividum]
MAGFTCATCGRYHDEMPLCFGADFPVYYYSIPPDERGQRLEMSNDWCVIDAAHFFIRGRLEIPIIDHPEAFCWNVWTSLSEENFIRSQELWHDPLRVSEQPYFGWLQTELPGYQDTVNCKTWVHSQAVGLIPQIVVFEEGHQLLLDQQNGITLEKAQQLVELVLHAE